MDLSILSDVFVVVVVGGMGSIPGAFLAAVIIGVLKALCIGIGDVSAVRHRFLLLQADAGGGIHRHGGGAGDPALGFVRAGARHAARRSRGRAAATACPRAGMLRVLVAALALLALLPLLSDRYTLVLLTDILVFALFAVSLHFIMGPGGMHSFGHAAYFGLGAYAAALLLQHALPMELALLLAPLAGGLGALAVRLVLRARFRRVSRDADPRLRANRLVGGVPMGCLHRRLQRTGRDLARALAVLQQRVLLSRARALRRRHADPLAHRVFALRLRAARGARLAAARRRHRHRRAPAAVAGLRARGHVCRARRRDLRVFERQHFARRAVDTAFGGRSGDGADGRHPDAHRRGGRRRGLHLAAGHPLAPDRLLARAARRHHPASGAGVSAGHRRLHSRALGSARGKERREDRAARVQICPRPTAACRPCAR